MIILASQPNEIVNAGMTPGADGIDSPPLAEAMAQETESEAIAHRVEALMTRQELLTARKPPLRLHAIVSEPALMLQVGSADLMRAQLKHIAKVATLPSVTVQVLRLTAGAPLAVHGASKSSASTSRTRRSGTSRPWRGSSSWSHLRRFSASMASTAG